jgi:tetratricopeptide (TPR) repeat protein
MAEPRRTEADVASDRMSDRDGRVEALLVEGLDHYFAGRFSDAIHIWTRVLFFDRAHARAHAYIDRARTALAERQRKSEELLQASQDFLDKGETSEARRLLSQAVASTGDDERAAALRVKLERVERALLPTRLRAAQAEPSVVAPEVVPGWTWPRTSQRFALAVAAALTLTLVGTVWLTSASAPSWMGPVAVPEATLAAASAPTAALSGSEVALIRARTLYARGRLAEALNALGRVGSDSTFRAEADRLTTEIQRLLLAAEQERPRK